MRKLLVAVLAALSVTQGTAFAGVTRTDPCAAVPAQVRRVVPSGAAAVVETPSGTCLVVGSHAHPLGARAVERGSILDAILCPILALYFPPEGDVWMYWVNYDVESGKFYLVLFKLYDCPPYDS